jgi:HlyD family secretion protein
VLESNERVVQAGTPLMETSNQDSLEVVIDLLTQEAVQVAAGDTVYLAGWGGDQTISAMVRQVEPQAFTKISALGVEEQRVNVIADLFQRPEELGAEYRVEAAIVTWQGQEVLTIPTSAIFQSPSGWYCYVVNEGRANLTPVTIGSRGREFTRVIAGVEEGDSVILYPSDLVADDVAVSLD